MKIQTKIRGKLARKPSNKRPSELLTDEEVKALIRACSTKASTGLRNRSLWVLLYRTGLRISEALALQPKDIDTKSRTVRVLHGKGDQSRTVGIDDNALVYLESWLKRRAEIGLTKRGYPIFCTLAGGKLDDEYCRQALKRVALKAGIEKRVHPHGLRHKFATELLKEGFDIHKIKTLLGHGSLSTTDIYLTKLGANEAIEASAERQWKV